MRSLAFLNKDMSKKADDDGAPWFRDVHFLTLKGRVPGVEEKEECDETDESAEMVGCLLDGHGSVFGDEMRSGGVEEWRS
jgi:hypothetical protein